MTEDRAEIQLTAEQENALVQGRNVAITAGAGTGKTTTLTERYVTILAENPSLTPENIVTITFTRKAAAELTERVREEVYDRLEAVDSPEAYNRWRTVLDDLEDGYVHTIHAFCARLLRERAVEAPVPLGFDVLDEDGAATLQREVVTEFLERNQDDEDVALLAQLWGRDQLVDVLTGLLDERPQSEAVLDEWRGADVDDYVDICWEVVCDLDVADARQTLSAEGLLEQLRTVAGRVDREGAIADKDGLRAYRTFTEVATTLPDDPEGGDSRDCQRAILELYEACEKKNGGLYSSSGYVVGDRDDWGEYGDVYDDLKDAIDAVIAAVEPHADAVETTPGELEANSAHYALALMRVFDDILTAYTDEKDRRDTLDFPDVIETTLQFLRTNDAVTERLREQFAAVMVDEFQDTDPRQWELVKLLTGVEEGAASNVFLVGDEKQSIYGFRGADVTTFGTARAELQAVNEARGVDDVTDSDSESPTALELSGNFRTLDEPLSFLNELFESLFQPEGDTHEPYEAPPQELTTQRDRVEDIEGLTGSVEYLAVPDDADTAGELFGDDHPVAEGALDHTIEAEAQALAARLTHLFDDPPTVQDPDTGVHREAAPDDTAILLRRRTHLDRYQRALEEYDIPYTVVGGAGFYDTPEVQTLTNLLRVLGDPQDDISLYGVLRSPLFGFADGRLAPAVAKADSVWDALAETDDPQLADAFDLLTTWRTLSGCATPSEDGVLPWNRLLSRVIDDTGYLASVSADERGQQAVANVEKFRDQVRTWSENGVHTAAGLLHRIDRQAEIDPREGEADIPGDAEGVRIMTIHSAKGLEFPIVTVPDLGSDLNFGRSIDDHGYVQLVSGTDTTPPVPAVGGPNPGDAFSIEKTAVHEYADRQSLPQERAESKRLLYVACTRTRDHLLLCGTHEITVDDTGIIELEDPPAFDDATRWRDWLQPSLLTEDLLRRASREGQARGQIGEASYTVRKPPRPVDWGPDEDIENPEPEISLPLPQTLASAKRIAATTLVTAVADASGESHSHTSGEESAGLSPTTFGTIVHRLTELRPPRDEWPTLIRRLSRMAGEEPTETDLRDAVEHAGDAVEFVDRVEANTQLQATYDEYSVVARLDDSRIVGDIDRLLVTPGSYRIIDYKTNDLSEASSAGLAEHYRPQMLAYALALFQHDRSRSVCASLRFTDAGVEERFDWEPTEYSQIESELSSMVELVSEWE
ncbi:UvrD-helicase domain-containing protein [Haloarcula argentinensis]|uniref:DNA 3'-5' helicase n=1 Tax=Haloarcula argentinensis TaxID=43776 RepID=A0ABU2F687_HALAR|nr:UvrD-helicase domain-containing protein [Haloarcula argentinensis]EMA17923.1 putative helicase [Haloarcula argentinensis DSM 12282]MDS0255621.1 UvrD-helicase domain-containing protein [Haloarcula argentinensis]